MTLSGMTCPIDGLALSNVEAEHANVARDRVLGKHVHILVKSRDVSCSEGHAWRVEANLTLSRRG